MTVINAQIKNTRINAVITSGTGVTNMSGLTDIEFAGLLDLDLLQYDNASSKWKNRTIAGAGLAPASHSHDDLYYTEAEVDALLANKSDTSHTHDGRYYTESEIDTLLAGKANTSHNHDDTYYTETEIDALLAAKANTSHAHAATDVSSGTFDNARISAGNVTQHVGAIDHDSLLNYDIGQHRTINDSGSALTDLWSASKINTELGNKAASGHTHAIDDLTDVTLSSIADGEVLMYSSGQFINRTLSEAFIASSNHNHAGIYLEEVVDDTTPQLGGDLDVNGNDIVSTSNGNINLLPNGTGRIGINTSSPDEKLHVVGNYVLSDADSATKAYRFRTNGAALDLDFAGNTLYFSHFPNADFTGSQSTIFTANEYGIVFNAGSGNLDFTVHADATNDMIKVDASDNRIGLGGVASPTDTIHLGGVTYIDDVSAPATTTNRLYSVSGTLYWNGTDLTAGGGGGISNVVEDTTPQLGGTLESNGHPINIDIADGGNVVALEINQNDVTNNPRAVRIINDGTANALRIDQDGNTSASTSVGGAINLDNTNNTGAGIVIYSNMDASSAGHLFVARADNAAFDQSAIYVSYDGTGNAVNLVGTGNGSGNGVLNVSSTNADESTIKITGQETGKGTLKITHTGTGTDSGASGIDIQLSGSGTAAKGLLIESASGTTGDLIQITNAGNEKFSVDANGDVSIDAGGGLSDHSYLYFTGARTHIAYNGTNARGEFVGGSGKGLALKTNATTEALVFTSAGDATFGGNVTMGSDEDIYFNDTDHFLRYDSGEAKLWLGAAADNKILKLTYGGASGYFQIDQFGVGEVLRIAGGKMGLGISSAVSPLHVFEDTTEVGANAGITVEQDGAGDALVQLVLTGTKRWVMGIDNSDGDKFKIADSADLASDVQLELDGSGLEITGTINATGAVTGSNLSGTNTGDESSATTSAQGIVELATTAETDTGTDTARAVTPAGLAASDFGKKILLIHLFDSDTDHATGDGKVGIPITAEYDQWDIVDAYAFITGTRGTDGTVDVQIRRSRAGTDVDVLSTKITVAASEWYANDGVVNTSNDQLLTGDKVFADTDAINSTTAGKGLTVAIVIQKK